MLRQILLVVCVLASSTMVRAQSADAEQLFKEARRLLGAGRIAEACDAFDASYRADANLSTLMNLADCRKQNGQLASAWAHFTAASHQSAARADRAKLHARATAEATALEPRLSFLIVNVSDESRIVGLSITRNGVTVEPGAWNRALPVDPGKFEIAGKAPGYQPWSTTVIVRAEGDRQSVEVPRFPEAVAPAPVPIAVPAVEPRDEPASVATPSTWRRPVAIAVASTGVALLLSAALLDASARDRDTRSRAEVDDDRQRQLHDSAVTRRYAAQALGGIGIAGLATGVVLWLQDRSARDSGRRSARLAPTSSGVGLTVMGVF